jgi:hypothetical protein
MLGEESLTTDQQLVLQAVYNAFRAAGRWPMFDIIDRQLYRELGLDVTEIIKDIPNTLLRQLTSGGARPQPSDKMSLFVAGVAGCDGSDDDIQHFVAALRWIVEREAAFEPDPEYLDSGMPVTAEDLATALDLEADPVAVRRLTELLYVESFGSASEGPKGWKIYIASTIREFRNVQTIDDYASIKAEHRRAAKAQRAKLVASASAHLPSMQRSLQQLSPPIYASQTDVGSSDDAASLEAKRTWWFSWPRSDKINVIGITLATVVGVAAIIVTIVLAT